MLSFENDYSEGAHEKILQRFMETNLEKVSGYGSDPYCESAKQKIREACECPQADVYFLTGGTQTNAVVISSMLESYERVLPMEKKERACLYYLFLYPEKYWKQLNFYYNSNKAWIPVRNIDKLRVLEAQQPARNAFLKRLAWAI